MNDRRLPIKFAVLIGLMATAALSSSNSQGVAQIAKPSPDKSSRLSAVNQQLVGEWRGKEPGVRSNSLITLIFAPDGTLIASFMKGQEMVALRSRYELNTQTQPMQMRWLLGEMSKSSTIFEFAPDGRLRLERFQDAKTPQKFEVDTLMQKISDSTTFKPDAQAIKQVAGQSGEPEARRYLDLLTQAQQAYHFETRKFATSIAQLDLDLKLETADYRYQIVSQGDAAKQIRIVGRAKRPDLKSFTGAVFSVSEVATLPGGYLSSLVCQTIGPSELTPAMPKSPSFPFAEVRCPSGSESARNEPSKN
ncbi:type IV pilin-like G/H family protein [Phormidesmis sp. 146-35]